MNAHPSVKQRNYSSTSTAKSCLPDVGADSSAIQVSQDLWQSVLAQSWKDIESVDLGEQCPRGAIKGRRPNTDSNEPVYIVPCALAETVSYAWLQSAIKSLSDSSEIYLGITADDSSIVYYKISSGIVKPPV
ncbi:Sen15 protein-domain-containing protein [Armillaria fumosa]|nr:Sen15 protein-domain-containing protein [Armillaria fumosa]